jgi:coenzyme F420-dependent glucose-6-phosphate dehydrogenase
MPLEFGYHALLEKYPPARLLDMAVLAERYGFDSVWASDHFHPWVPSEACTFAWSWLASAAERTKHVMVGTSVTAPTLRYNPAIVAQAFATLGALYPGRIFLGLGTGEAMNEVPTGAAWPTLKERIGRLEEAIKVIRLLWRESYVDFKGRYYSLSKANLFTKPSKPVPMYVAASGARAAELAGRYADGLITLGFLEPIYKSTLFPALERGAEKAGRSSRNVVKVVEVHVSYHEDFEKAVDSCRFLAGGLLPAMFKYPVYDPREIEQNATLVGKEALIERLIISSDVDEHIKRLTPFVKHGFDVIELNSLSPDDEVFITTFSKKVLPYLRDMGS